MAKKPITELQKKLRVRLEKEGWDNISHFSMKSGIQYSMETVRRAFNTQDYGKKLEPATLATIMFHLGFQPKEIKESLAMYTDDTALHKIISEIDLQLTPTEQSFIGAYRAITKVKPDITKHLAGFFVMVGDCCKIDVSAYTDQLLK